MADYIVAVRSEDGIEYFEIKADSVSLDGQAEGQFWNLPRAGAGAMVISKEAFVFAAPKDTFAKPPG